MTAKGEAEAIRQVEERYAKDKVLVVFLPECHESLAGIIAGRVREHFQTGLCSDKKPGKRGGRHGEGLRTVD